MQVKKEKLRAPVFGHDGRRARNFLGRPVQSTVENITLIRTKNKLAPKQWIKVTATIKPATFTEKAVVETKLYHLPFMEAVEKAQALWPNIPKSYTTLSFKPVDEPKKGE